MGTVPLTRLLLGVLYLSPCLIHLICILVPLRLSLCHILIYPLRNGKLVHGSMIRGTHCWLVNFPTCSWSIYTGLQHLLSTFIVDLLFDYCFYPYTSNIVLLLPTCTPFHSLLLAPCPSSSYMTSLYCL